MGNEAAAEDDSAAARPNLFVPTRRVLIVLEIGDSPVTPQSDRSIVSAIERTLGTDLQGSAYIIAADYSVDGVPVLPYG